jgi:aminoglycoside/choline kinase family phosphotransferase
MEWFEPEVRAMVSRLFGCPGDAARIEMLAAHASTRTYWRVHLGVGHAPRTIALMVLNREDQGIKSEEIVEIESTFEELPFVNVHRFLRSFTDAVPEIYFHDEANGLIYLEDLGDALFESVVAKTSDGERRVWYGRALDLLVALQTEGTRRLDESCVASKAAFTETLFLWEFEHFIEYGLGTKSGRDVDSKRLAVLRDAFGPIARALAAEPRVFTHRDFQSKNLLVQGQRLRLIDFQDALRGPRTYDLVALLRDSYVELSPTLLETLVDDYLARAGAAGFNPGRDAFREAFARMTLQRKLKDYGRFVYIDRVKGNPGYLRYNPANARYVLEAAARLPGIGAARRILEDALGPLAGRRA